MTHVLHYKDIRTVMTRSNSNRSQVYSPNSPPIASSSSQQMVSSPKLVTSSQFSFISHTEQSSASSIASDSDSDVDGDGKGESDGKSVPDGYEEYILHSGGKGNDNDMLSMVDSTAIHPTPQLLNNGYNTPYTKKLWEMATILKPHT